MKTAETIARIASRFPLIRVIDHADGTVSVRPGLREWYSPDATLITVTNRFATDLMRLAKRVDESQFAK